MKAAILFSTAAVFGSVVASASDDDVYYRLTITDASGQKHVYTSRELLERRDLEVRAITDTAAYPGREMAYRAIKIAHLLKKLDVPAEATVEFIARDGFTSPVEAGLLLNTSQDGAIAYLAVEDPNDPWPPHSSREETAGPFYLFWANPELSDIGREEWPYKFNKISINAPIRERYAAIVPGEDINHAHPASRGFDIFVKNCIACHKLNRIGPGTMGPDLSHPMSPVEYFRDGILRKFIRDPQSIRMHPNSGMTGFSKEDLSDEELDQLIAYLEYMAEKE